VVPNVEASSAVISFIASALIQYLLRPSDSERPYLISGCPCKEAQAAAFFHFLLRRMAVPIK